MKTIACRNSRTVALFVALLVVAGTTFCLSSTDAAKQEAPGLSLIGKSDKAESLVVSPDGRWLISWDGVGQNTPATDPGQRLVWDLSTGKSRDFTRWSADVQIYDNPCGFTPDNRIWNLVTNPQPLAEGNSPYTPRFYFENPDGTGQVSCHDKDPKFYFDNDSYFDQVQGFHFSPDGGIVYVLTNAYYRRFDTRTGKMLSRRRLGNVFRSERSRYLALSPDGTRILSSSDILEGYDAHERPIIRAGAWTLSDARSGKRLRRVPHPRGVELYDFPENDIFCCHIENTFYNCRLSDGKILSKGPYEAMKMGFTAPDALILWDKSALKKTVLHPVKGKWKFLVASPDRKFIYCLNAEDEIYLSDVQ